MSLAALIAGMFVRARAWLFSPFSDREKTESDCALAPSPSAGAALSRIATTQKSFPIYDGRRMSSHPGSKDMRGPPIEIFHEIFGYFRLQIHSTEPLAVDDHDNVLELVDRLAARDQYETNREIDLTKHLKSLCGIFIDKYKIHPKEIEVGDVIKVASGGHGDGVGYITLDDGLKIPCAHFEVKPQLGGGGKGDAALQAAAVARK
jgi:hypothetical protein